MREWSADVTVDEELVRRLIGGQFPQLDLEPLRLVAEGWDNAVWLVDERWAFRFPRRTIAIPGVEREVAVLPRLAPLLPLSIPTPAFVGRPAYGYPWPFFGAEFIQGRELADARLDDAARTRLACPLATFLRRLHSAEIAAAFGEDELPLDPTRRSDTPLRVSRTVERIAELEQLGMWQPPGSVRRILHDARALPAPEKIAVAHGDLHFRHVLVDDDGAPAGVIDWGDVCRADPAIDLLLLWSFFSHDGRSAFLEVYGRLTDEQLLRARVLALFLCAALAVYGHHEGMANVEREALQGLDRTVED